MVTVACVLYRDKEHTTYDAVYVEKLRSSVARWLPDHEFVCFSNVDVPGSRLPLSRNWKGWWSKFEVFNPRTLRGDVLYFDLDTIITGDIRPFAQRSELTLIHGMHGLRTPFGSGVMFLPEADRERIYNAFERQAYTVMTTMRGDQDFISLYASNARTWQEDLPGRLVSYKLDCVAKCGGNLPAGSSVVCFHGNPRPAHMPPSHWIHEYWR